MAFQQVVARSWHENRLFIVLLELTYRCNLDCYFCYNDLSLRGTPMRFEDYRKLFDDLAEMEVLNLILSGGEPLAHPDFFRIGAYARERGFLVRIKSNGHALRGALARKLVEQVDPFLIEISLHGGRAETHDRQTRVAGSFDRLLANFEELSQLGLRIKINSTLTRWNEGEIESMFAIADRFGFPIQVDPEVTPRDDGDRSPLDITASAEGIATLFRVEKARRDAQIAKLEREPGAEMPAMVSIGRQDSELMKAPSRAKHCGAGSSSLAIDPFGNVYPCVQWRRPVGNLHQNRVAELWNGSSELDEVRGLTVEVKELIEQQGEAGTRMAFCPGSAQTNTGSPLKIYDAAQRRADLMKEAEDKAAGRPSANDGATTANERALPVVY
jgi:MoaA/NifB/PqqE/SkfB family radical SAM enzyme